MGGAGSGVNELLMQEGQLVQILNIGLPDQFVPQGSQEEIRADLGLMPQVFKIVSTKGYFPECIPNRFQVAARRQVNAANKAAT